MTDNQGKLLDHHFGEKSKLDYFILSIDIAFLGWTVVNTSWLPVQQNFIYGMAACWLLVVASIVCGIVSRYLRIEMFGTNFLINQMKELVSTGQTALSQGATFLLPTGVEVPRDEVSTSIETYKSAVALGEAKFTRAGNFAHYLSNASPILLVLALCIFGVMKIIALLLPITN